MRAYPRASLSARAQRSAAQRSAASAAHPLPPPLRQRDRIMVMNMVECILKEEEERSDRIEKIASSRSLLLYCPRRVGEDLWPLWAWRSRLLKRS